MKPSVAMQGKQAAIREVVARHKTSNPRVFGSVLNGSDREGSDLDILVDALPGTTLFHLGGLTEELTELLGVRLTSGRRRSFRKRFGTRSWLRPDRFEPTATG